MPEDKDMGSHMKRRVCVCVYTNLRALPLLRLRLERDAKLLLELT